MKILINQFYTHNFELLYPLYVRGSASILVYVVRRLLARWLRSRGAAKLKLRLLIKFMNVKV